MAKIDFNNKFVFGGGVVIVAALSAFSIFSYFQESYKAAEAFDAKKVSVSVKTDIDYKIGGKYNVSWDSDCQGGEAIVWLSSASDEKKGIGILVPLTRFSSANFGEKGKDSKKYFSDPWKLNSAYSANKEKTAWIMPASLNLPRAYFNSPEGVFYVYTLEDGRFTAHKIVAEPIMMPVMPGNYFIRVDVKGKNGCQATGFSQKIKVVAK